MVGRLYIPGCVGFGLVKLRAVRSRMVVFGKVRFGLHIQRLCIVKIGLAGQCVVT